jgi:hypothetical protein
MAEEDLRSLLSRQHSRIDALEKQLNIRPAEAEDVDLPAAEYARNFCVTIAVCVYVCAFQGMCAFFFGGRQGNASQAMHLVWPICWTMLFAMLFGTLDSSAAGRRAVQLMRVFASSQVVLAPLLFRKDRGFGPAEAAVQILFQGACAIFYTWFSRVMAEVLRKRGSWKSQAEFYSNRALKVLGFQMLLVVSTLALGLDGPRTYPRTFAAESFSITLTFGWVFLIAIFDVAGVDGRAATKLRLSPLQAAALVSTGLLFLSGLGCYVVGGQKRAAETASNLLVYTMLLFWCVCKVFVGRLVAVARRAPVASTSVKPADALGSLDVP